MNGLKPVLGRQLATPSSRSAVPGARPSPRKNSAKRIPILYIALAVLVLVSVPPLVFFSIGQIQVSRDALETKEQELQNSIARSAASQIALLDKSTRQLLKTFSGSLDGIDLAATNFDNEAMRRRVEQLVSADPQLLSVSVLNQQAKGIHSGRFEPAGDPFVMKSLDRAFLAAMEGNGFFGEPMIIAVEGERVPAGVVSLSLRSRNGALGMLAAVVDLSPIRNELHDSSLRGLEVYVVDRGGRLMLHGDPDKNPIGSDLSNLDLVAKFLSWNGQARATATMPFQMRINGQPVPMLGTYCAIPSLQWAVIAQKKQADAYASVREMQFYSMLWGASWLIVCIVAAYMVAVRLSTPIMYLTATSRAIADGDFSRRIHIKSRTEIGELADTFNHMTAELESYIEKLKRAAEENHELFLSSIRMIAAAIDEKDPYTHGHAERVTQYSVLIARELGLSEEEVYKVKISAVLHDVGKIGIEDSILKKPGKLTPEEFEVMKTHTTRGAHIVATVPRLREMLPGIELHHESLDGSGYPRQLKGAQIPRMARIIAVADTFDAITSHRTYQSARDPREALEIIQGLAGRRYDPDIVKALKLVFETGKIRLQRVAAVA